MQVLILNIIRTLTIELIGDNSFKALQDLEQKVLIRFVKEPELNLYSLHGEPISDNDFIKWIEFAESTPTRSLTETK